MIRRENDGKRSVNGIVIGKPVERVRVAVARRPVARHPRTVPTRQKAGHLTRKKCIGFSAGENRKTGARGRARVETYAAGGANVSLIHSESFLSGEGVRVCVFGRTCAFVCANECRECVRGQAFYAEFATGAPKTPTLTQSSFHLSKMFSLLYVYSVLMASCLRPSISTLESGFWDPRDSAAHADAARPSSLFSLTQVSGRLLVRRCRRRPVDESETFWLDLPPLGPPALSCNWAPRRRATVPFPTPPPGRARNIRRGI